MLGTFANLPYKSADKKLERKFTWTSRSTKKKRTVGGSSIGHEEYANIQQVI